MPRVDRATAVRRSESHSHPAVAGDWRRRRQAAGVARTRYLRDRYAAGVGEGAEGFIFRVQHILHQPEDLDVRGDPVLHVEVQHRIATGLRRQVRFVTEQRLSAADNGAEANRPRVRDVVAGTELQPVAGNSRQLIASRDLYLPLGISGRIQRTVLGE